MKVILHIGTEKTGTTTIQNFLQLNKQELRNKGLAVLESTGEMNDRALSAYALRTGRYDDFYATLNIASAEQRELFNLGLEERISQEIAGLDPSIHTVIISSEHFHSRVTHKDELAKLKSLLDRFFKRIQIAVYIRPQVDLALSLYSTAIRNGQSLSLDEFIDQTCKPSNPYYNYSYLVKLWGGAFGEESLLIRRFESTRLLEGDLLKDFLAMVLCTSISGTQWNYPARENESLSALGQFTLRTFSKVSPALTRLKRVQNFSNELINRIADSLPGKGKQLSTRKRLDLERAFALDNERVRRRFFPGSKSLFETATRKPAQEGDSWHEQEDFWSAMPKVLPDDIDTLHHAAHLLEENDIETAEKLMALARFIQTEQAVISEQDHDYPKRQDALDNEEAGEFLNSSGDIKQPAVNVRQRAAGLDREYSGWHNSDTREVIRGFVIDDSDTVVDVGCGNAGHAEFCAQWAKEVIYCDLNAESVERTNEKIMQLRNCKHHGFVANLEALDLDTGIASKVLCNEILKYLENPAPALAELYRIGKPGCIYMLTVPDEYGELIQQKIAPQPSSQNTSKTRIYSREDFARLVEECGLIIEDRIFYGFYHALWWTLFWDGREELLDQWANLWAQLLENTKGRRVKDALDSVVPKSQIILARKPF